MPLQNDVADPSIERVADQPLLDSIHQTLGPDWLPVNAVPLGGEPVDLVLLHPQHGVALLQFAPRWTLDAPARLRHRLDQARFGAIFHGHLPIVHRMIRPDEAAALPRLLAEAFAGQPVLDLPAGDAWLSVVHRVLLARPVATPAPPHAPPRHAGRRTLWIAGGIGLAAVLATVAVLSSPGPTPQPMAALAEAITAATPLPAAAPPDIAAVEEPPPSEPGPRILAAVATGQPTAMMPPLAEPSTGAAPATEPPPAEAPPAESPAIPAAIELLGPPDEPQQPPAVPAPPPMLALATVPLPVVDIPLPPPATPAPATLALVAPPPAPPPTRTTPRQGSMDAGTRAALLRRGEALLALGDVSGARRFFERVAEAGDPAGAEAMGRTHDPVVLAELRAWGIAPDPVAAAGWYRRAREMELIDKTETTR